MRAIARTNIKGIKDDIGLYALNGIIFFEANVTSIDDWIELFTLTYPNFKLDSIEIVDSNM